MAVALASLAVPAAAQSSPHDALIARHAAANGVPEALVRRVIMIETKGNPRLVSKGNYGLMQIRVGTARAMGYSGSGEGLLDADTNMTYAVKYLAGAYRAAGGNMDRAVHYYQRGYYGEAKARGFTPYRTASVPAAEVETASVPSAPGAEVTLKTNEPSKEVQVTPATARTLRRGGRARTAVAVNAPLSLNPLAFFAEHAAPPEQKHRRRHKPRT